MLIRFTVTFVNKEGWRTLAMQNTGKNHYETRELAQKLLDSMLRVNSVDTLNQVFGVNPRFEVREVECYAHGDAKTCWFGYEGEDKEIKKLAESL